MRRAMELLQEAQEALREAAGREDGSVHQRLCDAQQALRDAHVATVPYEADEDKRHREDGALTIEVMVALSTDVRTAHYPVVEYLTLRQMARGELVRWLIQEGRIHE